MRWGFGGKRFVRGDVHGGWGVLQKARFGGFTKLFQSFHETSCRPKENGREHKNDPLRSFGGVIFLGLSAVLGRNSVLDHDL